MWGGVVFTFPVNVRYMEVDAQGVVFNAWYLAYFDDAMTAFLAHGGLPYRTMLDAGYDVQLVRSEIDYRAGVHWQDPIEIAVSCSAIGRTSFTLDFEVRKGPGSKGPGADTEVCTRGRTVYVVIATDGTGKREVPPIIRSVLREPDPLF